MNLQTFITLENQTLKISYSNLQNKKHFYIGEKLGSFEGNDKLAEDSSDLDFNDTKYASGYREENIYLMFHQKFISTQEYETSTEKKRYHYL